MGQRHGFGIGLGSVGAFDEIGCPAEVANGQPGTAELPTISRDEGMSDRSEVFLNGTTSEQRSTPTVRAGETLSGSFHSSIVCKWHL